MDGQDKLDLFTILEREVDVDFAEYKSKSIRKGKEKEKVRECGSAGEADGSSPAKVETEKEKGDAKWLELTEPRKVEGTLVYAAGSKHVHRGGNVSNSHTDGRLSRHARDPDQLRGFLSTHGKVARRLLAFCNEQSMFMVVIEKGLKSRRERLQRMPGTGYAALVGEKLAMEKTMRELEGELARMVFRGKSPVLASISIDRNDTLRSPAEKSELETLQECFGEVQAADGVVRKYMRVGEDTWKRITAYVLLMRENVEGCSEKGELPHDGSAALARMLVGQMLEAWSDLRNEGKGAYRGIRGIRGIRGGMGPGEWGFLRYVFDFVLGRVTDE